MLAVAAGGVERAGHRHRQWNRRRLAALADNPQDPMPALFTEIADVNPARFGDAQSEHAEQIREAVRVRAECGTGVQERHELEVRESERATVAWDLGSAYELAGVAFDQVLSGTVPVEAADRGYPDGRQWPAVVHVCPAGCGRTSRSAPG